MLTIVTGLGRCGLSLTMQMLDAAGLPVVGTFPGYEVARGIITWQALRELNPDAVVKIVDPVKACRIVWSTQAPPCRVIYCRRLDKLEQGKSALAMTAAGMPGLAKLQLNDAAVKMAASYIEDEKQIQKVIADVSARVLDLPFELLVQNPIGSAGRIADFLELPETAIGPMVAQARHRNAHCQHLAIERKLIEFGRLRTMAEALENP